jgi:hypothetical protein
MVSCKAHHAAPLMLAGHGPRIIFPNICTVICRLPRPFPTQLRAFLMNNLILSSLLLGSGAVLFLSAREWKGHIHVENARLAEQVQAAGDQDARSRASVEELRIRLTSQEIEVAAARESLNQARAELATVLPPEPDPANEGFWPAAQPYFYLPKRHLAEIGYTTFTADNRLTTTAAMLFGMTPQETAAVEEAAERVLEDVAGIELQRVERLEAVSERDPDRYQEIRFRLRPVEREIVERLQPQFANDVISALGAERASLLLDRTVEQANQWFANHFGAQELTLSLKAERNPDGRVQHVFQIGGRNGSMITPVTYPLSPDSPIGRWQHLLGDAPLLEERFLEAIAQPDSPARTGSPGADEGARVSINFEEPKRVR